MLSLGIRDALLVNRDMTQSDSPSQQQNKTKEGRLNNPSGWLYLTQHESVPILIDAVLDWPTTREFTTQEFVDHSGLVRQTVSKHLDMLVEIGILEQIPEAYPQRYRITNSEVTRELFELNSALNAPDE